MVEKSYDFIIIGAGASGMMAAIVAARTQKKVLLLEKLSNIGAKLKATGGGRCNLTNTLDNETFMKHFGREGRFMSPALERLDHQALIAFFQELGVESHAPDGFRVFPVTHHASTILHAMEAEMTRLNVEVRCSQKVLSLLHNETTLYGIKTAKHCYYATFLRQEAKDTLYLVLRVMDIDWQNLSDIPLQKFILQ